MGVYPLNLKYSTVNHCLFNNEWAVNHCVLVNRHRHDLFAQ